MSVTLPFVDLSSAVVGTSGTIALQALGLVAVPSQDAPHLQLYNDSGAGLLITLKKSQQQFYLGAKGHSTIAISNSESEIAYSVQNVATNIQVNQLWAVYYYPGEEVSDFVPLGTSTVSQQATTVLNVGNPFGTEIFFAQPVGDTGVTGASVITNSGKIILGDGFVGNGHISIVGATTQDTQIDAGLLTMKSTGGTNDIDIEPGSITLNGSTSGTATIYQIFRGTFKYAIVVLSNFRNGGVSAQTLAIPSPFTTFTYIRTSDVNAFQLIKASVAQTIFVITALASGGGTTAGVTSMGSSSFGESSGCDTISFNSGAASAHNGLIIIEGI